jgi:hypothetical protein
MNSKASAAAVVLLALALGLAWFSFNARREAEASLAAIAGRRATLDGGVRDAEAKIAAAERDQAAIQAVIKELQARKPPPSPARPPAPKPPDEATLLMQNPELLALYAKSFRANLNQRYGLIYQALGLSPDQVEKLNDHFTEEEKEKMKLLAAAASQGLDRSDPDIQAMLWDLGGRYDRTRADLIGETASNQFIQLYNAVPFAPMVNDTASFLALSSTPLTAPQEMQLMQVLSAASSHDEKTGQANPASVNWENAFQQAQVFLSAPQLAALKVEFQLSELVKANKQFYQQPPAPK